MSMVCLRKKSLGVATVLALLYPLQGKAGQLEKADPDAETARTVDRTCVKITKRPLSDFLSKQGKLNRPPQFFPPAKDYVGWVDAVDPITKLQNTFALIDYAGLADKYLNGRIGTKITGRIVQCERPNGKARITVDLSAEKALGFAQSVAALKKNKFDFLNTLTIFGAKAQDVKKRSAHPAVGPATLLTTFTISAHDAALPDFLDVVNNPGEYAPVHLNLSSTTFGKCADGRPARLTVHQVAATDTEDQNNLDYTVETVEAVDKSGSPCDPKL